MYTSKWCNENLNSGKISFKDIKNEMVEVIEAETFGDMMEEISDVLYFSYCALELKTGINLPMFGAKKTVEKVVERVAVWKLIFAENDLEFSARYLVNGSNYAKDEKVKKALYLAKMDQGA